MTKKSVFFEAISEAVSFGVDVSKRELVLCVLTAEKEHHYKIENNHEAIGRLADALVERNYAGKIIMESTGYYHWLLAVELRQRDLDVRLVNPLLASKHHKGAIRKTKTDPVDAAGLALMGLTERRLPPTWERDANWVQMRHKIGLIRTFDKTLQKLTATLRDHQDALAIMGLHDDAMVDSLVTQVQELERAYRKAEAELAREFAGFNDENHQRYKSIPGFSDYTAGLLNVFMSTTATRPKAWVAFAGLDISVKQSGSWVGRSKLSKRGNAYLRKKLYQAAWAAKQNDPAFNAYYQRLREDGHGYVESLLIIARKLLRTAFTLQRDQKMYDQKAAWA